MKEETPRQKVTLGKYLAGGGGCPTIHAMRSESNGMEKEEKIKK